MKRKIYITPAIKVKKIAPHKILAVSLDVNNNTPNNDDDNNSFSKGGIFNLDAPVPASSDNSGDSDY